MRTQTRATSSRTCTSSTTSCATRNARSPSSGEMSPSMSGIDAAVRKVERAQLGILVAVLEIDLDEEAVELRLR